MGLKAKDIAKMLGVSTSTVSLVMNNKPGVGSKKRAEIIQQIKDLNCEYLLKEEEVEYKELGFVVYKRQGDIIDESPFFSYILEGINSQVKRYGYKMTFLYLNKEMSSEEKEKQLREAQCEGLIVFAVEMVPEDLEVFKKTNNPFVILDNSFQENDVDAVAINNMQGVFKAMEYLYECGHKEIGYIQSKVPINSFEERYESYKKYLKKWGLPYKEQWTVAVGYSEVESRLDIKEYLKTASTLPTAFLCDNDLLACGSLKGFREFGYAVPGDISLIGFDDRPICTLIEPALTTIAVPKDIFGPCAVDLLLQKLQKKRVQSMKVEVGVSLIKRESVKKLR